MIWGEWGQQSSGRELAMSDISLLPIIKLSMQSESHKLINQ